MVQKVITELVDDLDGGQAAETIDFALDGMGYVIDLSEANAQRLRDAFARYVSAARLVAGNGASRKRNVETGERKSAKPDKEQQRAIREWAQRNGYRVSDRGRISADVIAAFNAVV